MKKCKGDIVMPEYSFTFGFDQLPDTFKQFLVLISDVVNKVEQKQPDYRTFILKFTFDYKNSQLTIEVSCPKLVHMIEIPLPFYYKLYYDTVENRLIVPPSHQNIEHYIECLRLLFDLAKMDIGKYMYYINVALEHLIKQDKSGYFKLTSIGYANFNEIVRACWNEPQPTITIVKFIYVLVNLHKETFEQINEEIGHLLSKRGENHGH